MPDLSSNCSFLQRDFSPALALDMGFIKGDRLCELFVQSLSKYEIEGKAYFAGLSFGSAARR